MRNAFYIEYDCLEVTRFKRRIVEDVKVFGSKSIFGTGSDWKTGRNFPGIRRKNLDSRRSPECSSEIHQKIRVIPEAMFRIQLACSHREFVGVNPIAGAPFGSTVSSYLPGILIEFLRFKRLARSVRRLEVLDLTFKLANQIRTRCPNRHDE